MKRLDHKCTKINWLTKNTKFLVESTTKSCHTPRHHNKQHYSSTHHHLSHHISICISVRHQQTQWIWYTTFVKLQTHLLVLQKQQNVTRNTIPRCLQQLSLCTRNATWYSLQQICQNMQRLLCWCYFLLCFKSKTVLSRNKLLLAKFSNISCQSSDIDDWLTERASSM